MPSYQQKYGADDDGGDAFTIGKLLPWGYMRFYFGWDSLNITTSLPQDPLKTVFFYFKSKKLRPPSPPFFGPPQFFLIRILWIGEDHPLLKKMVKNPQFLVKNGKKNLSIF